MARPVIFTPEKIAAVETTIKEELTEYVRITVDSLLPEEHVTSGTLTPGSDISTVYPVKDHDTANGYPGIFYVDEGTYHGFPDTRECRIPFREKEDGKG
jgi:hypothetical protein